MKTADSPVQVVFIRHAQSQWNLENRFSGWADPPLTAAGEAEAQAAADLLLAKGFTFDVGYCSRLQRAGVTLDIILGQMQITDIPVIADWRLNERHYGALQGKIKTPEANNTTEHQIWLWRRSYLAKAAPLAQDDARHPRRDPRYNAIDPALLPSVENLQETRHRIMDVWNQNILPDALAGKKVIVSAHGNSLRALLMGIAEMSIEQVESFEIPTGIPLLVEMDSRGNYCQWYYLKH